MCPQFFHCHCRRRCRCHRGCVDIVVVDVVDDVVDLNDVCRLVDEVVVDVVDLK